MTIKKSLESRIRGWLPKEACLKSNRRVKISSLSDENGQKRLIKMISVADVIVMIIFNSFKFVYPHEETFEFVVMFWVGFFLSLFSVNLLISYSWRQKINRKKMMQFDCEEKY